MTTQSAQAFTFGNIDFNTSGSLSGDSVKNSIQRAYQFTFTGDPNYKLENVQLRLNRFTQTEANVLLIKGTADSSTPLKPPTVNSSNSVSFSTTQEATGTGASGYQNITFNPSAEFFFEPGETYWLSVAANSGGDFGWRMGTEPGANPESDPTGVAAFNSFSSNLDNSNWSTTVTGMDAVLNGTNGRGLFAINAVKVPEPSNLIGLFTVVVLGMMSFKRQK
ncbi:MAG: PEP-CTERM sorting domain-containing protein [Cyanobacterium sp. T60_A2020_053]|nr:PEP-CTERM sorting domain-containing protein [Cyanobacterium sp. T60_A2020_053]